MRRFDFLNDSLTKLIVYVDYKLACCLLSPDVPKARNGKFAFYSDPDLWSFELGVQHLKEVFEQRFKNKNVTSAIIASRNYNHGTGDIFYSFEAGKWIHGAPQIIPTQEPPKEFIFKVWFQFYKQDGTKESITFFSCVANPQAALFDVVKKAKYFASQNNAVANTAQVYGDGSTIFNNKSKNVPRYGFLCLKSGAVYYHKTNRETAIFKAAQMSEH